MRGSLPRLAAVAILLLAFAACSSGDAFVPSLGPDAGDDGRRDPVIVYAPNHSNPDAGTLGDASAASCVAPKSLLCSGVCVDPSGPAHCGSCTQVCTVASGHGSPVCSVADGGPTCSVLCDAGHHACNGDCFADSDSPSVVADSCILTEDYGVFVAPSGPDAGDGNGTRTSPFTQIGHAIAAAKTAGKHVYACQGNYSDNLVVDATGDGVAIYGGLDCSNPAAWIYRSGQLSTVQAPPSGYPLRITGLTTGVEFDDFAFVAPPATTDGGSSIAIFASNSNGVVLRRCAVTGGDALPGKDAEPLPPLLPTVAPAGNPGTSMSGGATKPNIGCGASAGGAGGPPAAGGADGQVGQPNFTGLVPGHASSQNCGGGGSGGPGADGGYGDTGVDATAWATFSGTGWTPKDGTDGTWGRVGEGGCGGASLDASGGGGGGGPGGCGGYGGLGGHGGGSSITVLSFLSSLDLEACTLSAGKAGRGGYGLPGQAGQVGGAPGSGSGTACAGGPGGKGGDGGNGGGGAGGVSVGVAWSGTAPIVDQQTVSTATTLPNVKVGAPGGGGASGTPGNTGLAGVAKAVLMVP